MEFSEFEIIERLRQLPKFSTSQSKIKLLNYLYECYKKNIVPSEIQIAIDVFGKDDHFDTTIDPLVRVYISKVRKILSYYYENEGKNHKIKVSIPNRKYVLKFYEVQPLAQTKKYIKKLPSLPYTLSIISILLMTILFLLFFNSRTNQNNNYADSNFHKILWSPFLESEFPTIYIVGNLFTYKEYNPNTDTYRIVRDFYINNIDDLTNYLSKFPSKKETNVPNWEIIPKSSLINFMKVFPLFANSGKEFSVKTSSKFEYKDVVKNNIIFIGHFHNLGNLRSLFPKSHFQTKTINLNYSIFDSLLTSNYENDFIISATDWTKSEKKVLPKLRELIVTNGSFDTTYASTEFKEDMMIAHDYVVVSKLPGPSGSNILLIISFSSLGRQKVIDLLINSNFDNEIKKILPNNISSIPNYFEMLIEVKGLEQEAIKISIKHFFSLDEEFKIYE